MEYFLIFVFLGTILAFLAAGFRVVTPGNLGVVERLGKFVRRVKPGATIIIPFLDTIHVQPTRPVEVHVVGSVVTDGVRFNFDVTIFVQLMDDSFESAKAMILWVHRSKNERMSDVVGQDGSVIEGRLTRTMRQLVNYAVEEVVRGYEPSAVTRDPEVFKRIRSRLVREGTDLLNPWGVVSKAVIASLEAPDEIGRTKLRRDAEARRQALVTAEQARLEVYEQWKHKYGKAAADKWLAAETLREIGVAGGRVNVFTGLGNLLTGFAATRLADRRSNRDDDDLFDDEEED